MFPQDLERAVIDVHVLSRCAVVHGSGLSSYSELAHHLRTAADAFAVRFTRVNDDDDHDADNDGHDDGSESNIDARAPTRPSGDDSTSRSGGGDGSHEQLP